MDKAIVIPLLFVVIYITPWIIFIKEYNLIRAFSFTKFRKALNGIFVVEVILFIVIFMAIAAAENPIMEDPEYPEPSESLLVGAILFYAFSVIILLPVALIMNIMFLVKKNAPNIQS
jgi:hypothetical protein